MIYFDNASTCFLNDKDIFNYFLRCNKNFSSNPNSNYKIGYFANKALNETRKKIIDLLQLDFQKYDVIFNSGATEGINHALKGYALKNKNRGNEIISFINEHTAVLETLHELAENGFKVNYISCDKNGEINYEELKKKINSNTIMVIIMAVNNEVGSINNINKIFNITKKYPKCVFFSDVTQGIGKIKIDYKKIDMFVFSAHKLGGLIGSGVLVKKKGILLKKLIVGGDQENNYRSGTVSVPLAMTTAYVLEKNIKKINTNFNYVNSLKKKLILELLKMKNEIEINSNNKFPYIVNFSLKLKKASVLIEAFSEKNIYVSSLSACNSKKDIASYVLINMKKSEQIAKNAIRVSFSYKNNFDEIDCFLKEMKKNLNKIKNV